MNSIARLSSDSVLLVILCFSIGCIAFCQASQFSEDGIFCSFSPRSDLKQLLPLVRGGTIPSGYYQNTTDNERMVYVNVDENGEGKAQWLPTSTKLLRNMPTPVSLRRTASQESSLHTTLEYRDVLQCKSPQGMWSSDFDSEESKGPSDDDDDADDSLFSDVDFPYLDSEGRLDVNRGLPHSPVVYQYYGRSRVRGNPSDSVHFILLGPNVDHWKAVGRVLASRGFNAMACERVDGEDSRGKVDRDKDAPNLVLEIMEALKWNRAILVGCDSESILAMETTMMLAPDRVAGLVLCGDLKEPSRRASETGVDVLDSFLRRILGCPFLIVWDGDSPSGVPGSSVHHAALETNSDSRCLILGGGSAPHRMKPEQFAWILTRFVEEKLELTGKKSRGVNSEDLRRGRGGQARSENPGLLRALNLPLPFGINTLVSPEGRLLLGRAVAASLFYITMMRVIIIQYGTLRIGLIGIKSQYDTVDALRRKVFQAIAAFFWNYGYIPRLFSVKKAVEDDEDEDVGGTFVGPLAAGEEGSKEDSEAGDEDSDVFKDISTDEEEDKTAKKDDEKVDDDESPRDDHERPKFRPLFFLDHVVT